MNDSYQKIEKAENIDSGIKIVGRAKKLSAAENLLRAENLLMEAQILSPYKKPSGFVFKAKTRREYEKWKKKQKNPWLW